MPLVGDRVKLAPRPHRSFRRPLRRRLFHASAHAPAAAGRAPNAPSSCARPLQPPPSRPHSSPPSPPPPPVAPLRSPHGYCTAVVLCVAAMCLRGAGQRQRSAPANLSIPRSPFLERRILQVGVFGGSGVHTPSRGRAARGARMSRSTVQFFSLFLI